MIPKYIRGIPSNVLAAIKATTVFGNKYVALTSPENPASQPITPSIVIEATSVTTEFNTLFETLTSIAEKVDPVKVNLTLSAAAQALAGLGDRFGASIVNGNAILDDLNPQLPRVRYDLQQLAALGDVYADAVPDLWDALDHAVTTARTLNRQQRDLDAALLAAAGVGNTGADVFERRGPVPCPRGRRSGSHRPVARRVQPRNLLHDPQLPRRRTQDPQRSRQQRLLAGRAFRGRDRGCPQPLHLAGESAADQRPRGARWGAGLLAGDHPPAVAGPYLVMDTGNSVAPYNHLELGSPLVPTMCGAAKWVTTRSTRKGTHDNRNCAAMEQLTVPPPSRVGWWR